MAVDSLRADLIRRFVERLQTITTGNGFLTDAGAALLVGVDVNLGEADVDQGIVLLIGDDQVPFVGEHARIVLPFVVQAVVKVPVTLELSDPLATQDRVEALLVDIKRAVELEDRYLGIGPGKVGKLERGPTAPLARDAGSEYVGATILYRIGYSEAWGSP